MCRNLSGSVGCRATNRQVVWREHGLTWSLFFSSLMAINPNVSINQGVHIRALRTPTEIAFQYKIIFDVTNSENIPEQFELSLL